MPTFGKTAQGGSGAAIAEHYQQASKYTLSVNGTVTDIRLYLTGLGGGGTQVIRAVCWADSAGNPGALKISSNEQTLSAALAAGWVTFTLPASVPLVAGDYWLGWAAGVTEFKLQYLFDTVTAARRFRAVTYASAPSDPFGTPDGSGDNEISVYATYDVAGTPPTLNTTTQSNLRSN